MAGDALPSADPPPERTRREVDQRSRREDYRAARIGGASAIIMVVVMILLIDAVRTDYEVNPVVLFTLLGTAGALVGIELRDPRFPK